MELQDFHAAFIKAQELSGKSNVEIAALLGVSEQTVARWHDGIGKPRKPTVIALRAVWPTFAKVIDGKVAA
jgi:DNA-binding transcriptional regulator YiaG